MTKNSSDRRPVRPPAGDPRLRVLLFLIAGGLLLYATFNRGPDPHQVTEVVGAEIRADVSSYRPARTAVTKQHAAADASKRRSSISIASSMAVPISDLSEPGQYNCAVGYAVTNNSARDVSGLLFEVAYTSPQAQGSSVATISVPARSTQGITPVNAVKGRCDGVTGQVIVHSCSYSDGTDCRKETDIIDRGAIALVRAP